jgi:hypothetical protein
MNPARLLAALALTAPAWGYSYYVDDNLSTVDPAKWSTIGALTPGSAGLAASDSAGGSLISRVPIPDASGEAEIRATIRLAASGGTYTEFLQATPDARTGGDGRGSYLAFEMQNPQLDADGNCAANFVVLQSVAGIATLLTVSARLPRWHGTAHVRPRPNPAALARPGHPRRTCHRGRHLRPAPRRLRRSCRQRHLPSADRFNRPHSAAPDR